MSDRPVSGSNRESIVGKLPSAQAIADDSNAPTISRQIQEPDSQNTKPPLANEGTSITGAVAPSSNAEEQHVGVGTELGYYRLLKKLGEGGMGSVWQAVHTKLDKQVAVKVLPATWNRDPALLTRFEREMKAVGKLEHPHIVRAMDAGEFNGTHYLVMEFNEGMDLSAWVKQRGPQSVKNACEMLRHAALGLAHAHEEGLIHRDIKPSNLFLTKSGKVKILDLGLARVQGDNAGGGQTLTGFGQVLGTPDYMAPEQWENTHSADGRADLYALGCTLFYFLTGRAPFSDEKHSGLVGKMKGHTLDPIPDLKAARCEAVANRPKLANDLISDELDALYRRLMAKRPDERFESATDLAQALLPLGTSTAGASSVLVKGHSPVAESSPVAPRQDSRMSLDVVPATAPQATTDVTRAPGPPVAERQGYEATKPLLMTEFEPDAPTDTTNSGNDPAILTMLAGTSPARQHDAPASGFHFPLDASVSGQTKSKLDHSLARRAGGPGGKLGLILGGVGTVVLLVGVIAFAFRNKGGSSEPLEAPDEEVVTEVTVAKKDRRVAKVDSDSKPVKLESKKVSVPQPSTPEPTATTPVVTSPIPTTPEPAAATSAPGRTLIVGIAPGEIGDIGAAIAQAIPGDTILIRHRGPLEFRPVDLTGKTPLTIAGDVKDGVDYWPILRQGPSDPESANQPAEAAFRADQLQLTFRKLHLGLGGPLRQPILAGFRMASGSLTFDDCTITVAAHGAPSEPMGTTLPLVRCVGPSPDSTRITFQRTLIRGARLTGCVDALNSGPIEIDGQHLTWVGSPGTWISLQEFARTCQIRLQRSTLYDFDSLLSAALSNDTRPNNEPAIAWSVNRSVLVARYAGKTPLLNCVSPTLGDAAAAARAKAITWQGEGNVFHRISRYCTTENRSSVVDLKHWMQLFDLSEQITSIEVDPMFRVWPTDVRLEETTAYDLQARLARSLKRLPKEFNTAVGTDSTLLPAGLACLFSREWATGKLAGQPRGRSRILRVHQKDGPHKTLESAFDAAQTDDIIEVADKGPYIPKRDFSATGKPAPSVLVTEADYLMVRAADGIDPVVVLSEKAQSGPLPEDPGSNIPPNLTLISSRFSGRQSLQVDGLHFRTEVGPKTIHTLFRTYNGDFFRCTNSSIVVEPGTFFWGAPVLLFGHMPLIWFENSVFLYLKPTKDPFVNFGLQYGPGETSYVFVAQNCLFGGNAIVRSSINLSRLVVLRFQRNTFLGRSASLGNLSRVDIVANDNLVFSDTPPLEINSSNVKKVQGYDSGNNAVWLTAQPLTFGDRDKGLLGFLPGPLLKVAPQPEGTGSAKEPYRKFRLKKNQPSATLASDGGPVGIRAEYLPNLPSVPAPFLQGK